MKPDRATLDAAIPDVAMGVRAALATVIPFALAAFLDRPELAWMALGGWLGTLVDPGGSTRQRARSLLAFTILGALVVALTETVAPSPPHAAALLVTVVFIGSSFRSLGAAAATLGTMLAVVCAIAAARSHAVPWKDCVAFVAGSGFAIVLSTIVWPVWTHLPVRRAVGVVLRDLADYARAIDRLIEADVPSGDERWIAVARTHARKIRGGIEAARAVSLAVRARRPGETRRGGNLRLLLAMAENQFILLVTIAMEVEAASDRRAACPHAVLDLVARRWEKSHERLVAHATPDDEPKDHGPPSRAGAARDLHDLTTMLEHESEVASDLAASIDTASPLEAKVTPDGAPKTTLAREARSTLRTLRDSLTFRSTFFRHAIRASTAVAVASFVGAWLSPHHASWVTITCIAVLQPFPGATATRAFERFVGTALGCVVAAALAHFVTNHVVLALTMFPLSVAAVVSRSRSYRLFTFFLTPLFVPLAMHDGGDTGTLLARLGDVLLGGGVAVIASWTVFPSWERQRLPETLATMETSVLRYVDQVLAKDEAIDDARRSAGVAIGEAEASLERLLGEPRPNKGQLERALELVTFSRRLAVATTALYTLAHHGAPESVIAPARNRVDRLATMVRAVHAA
ncbi:FUSC family protein [soil metagenome]